MFDFSRIARGKKDCLMYVISTLYEIAEIDNTKLKDRFDKYSHLIEPIIDTDSALDELEKIYNWKTPKKNIVFLKTIYKKEALNRNAVYKLSNQD